MHVCTHVSTMKIMTLTLPVTVLPYGVHWLPLPLSQNGRAWDADGYLLALTGFPVPVVCTRILDGQSSDSVFRCMRIQAHCNHRRDMHDWTLDW